MNNRAYFKMRAVNTDSENLHRVYIAKINEVDNLIKSAKFLHQVISAKGRRSKTATKRI